MKKYIFTMVLSLVAIGLVSFGQTITVRDNASTTAPVDQVRNFGVAETPVSSSLVLSNTVGTTTGDVTRTTKLIPLAMTSFHEVATTAALLTNNAVPGVILFQFNTDDDALYITLTDSAGDTWGCKATMGSGYTGELTNE